MSALFFESIFLLPLTSIFINVFSLCADPVKFGAKHLRRAKQPAVPGEQDHERGEGFAQMRALQRFPAGPARLLRAGTSVQLAG
jgi:hypothetical protein